MTDNTEALSILQRLKSETRIAHEQVENNDFTHSLGTGAVSREAYAWFLRKLYGFIKPYEAHLHRHPFPPELAVDKRQRADLILQDLASLNPESYGVPPLCTDLPPLRTFEDMLGCMYVIEGSTLGGQVITRQLDKAGIQARAYFTGNGDQTGKLWKAFCQFITQAAETADQEAIIRSAGTTFSRLNDWMNTPETIPMKNSSHR